MSILDPVYKRKDKYWYVNDERAIGLAFETRAQAELVLAMCPFVDNVNDLVQLIRPIFRMLLIKSEWSK